MNDAKAYSGYPPERVAGELVVDDERLPVAFNELEQLAGKWVASLHSKSPRTRDAYRAAVVGPPRVRKRAASKTRPGAPSWFGWCASVRNDDGATLDPLAAKREAVDVYMHELLARGLAESTRAQRLAALSSFYRYLQRAGRLDRSPTDFVDRPLSPWAHDSPRQPLTLAELRRLLVAAGQRPALDRALVTLLALTGLRASSACTAAVRDLDRRDEDGRPVVQLTVVLKGNRRETLELPAEVMAPLDLYLAGRTEGPLFRVMRGGNWRTLDRATTWRIVTATARDAEIKRPCSPHILRHTFATHTLRGGVPLDRVQKLLGHSSPTVTARYAKVDEKALSADLARFAAQATGTAPPPDDAPATAG